MENTIKLLNAIIEGVEFSINVVHTDGTVMYDLMGKYENDLPIMIYTTDDLQDFQKYIKAFSDGVVTMYGVHQFREMR